MYLVDANILIEAKNRYYAFDIAPGFWEWLDRAHRQGVTCSIDSVRDELLRGDDELTGWAAAHRDFFRPLDQRTTTHFGALTAWVTAQGYRPSAINAFTGKDADFQLIAFAVEHGFTVATHERPKPNARKRVLIPDVCVAMGVPTVDTFDMMRATGASLHFASAPFDDGSLVAPTLPGLE
ncbi:DUF4411 family protein [Brachybacterium tyrofermentans]|uniref:DUF4411 family protein n=1 Tax=Brachybacterium tyrofermentans TaxID=47848 RepID=UPI003FD30FD4